MPLSINSSLPVPAPSTMPQGDTRLGSSPFESVMSTSPTEPSSTAWPSMPSVAQQAQAPQATQVQTHQAAFVPQMASQPAATFSAPTVNAQQPATQQFTQTVQFPQAQLPQQTVTAPLTMPTNQAAHQQAFMFRGPTPMEPDPALANPTQNAQVTDGTFFSGRVDGATPIPGVGQTSPVPAAPAVPPSAGAPHTQQPSQAASTALRDALIQQGYDFRQYQSDAQLLQDIGLTVGQIRQLQAAQYQSQQPLQESGQQGEQQDSQQQSRSRRPEWKPEWSNLVRLDEHTGVFVPVDPTAVNPVIVQRANEYAQWKRDRAEAILRDPLAVLREEGLDEELRRLRDEIKQEVISDFRARQQLEAEEREVQQFLDQHQAELFVLDPTGRKVVNPLTGAPALTPRGEAFKRFADEYERQFVAAYGIRPSQKSVIEHAQLRLQVADTQGMFGQQPQQFNAHQTMPAAQPAAPQNMIAQRMQAMNGAAYAPGQGGTIAAAAQVASLPQNQRVDFKTMLIDEARLRGQIPL